MIMMTMMMISMMMISMMMMKMKLRMIMMLQRTTVGRKEKPALQLATALK